MKVNRRFMACLQAYSYLDWSLSDYLEYFLAYYSDQDDPYSYGAASFIRSLLSRIYSGSI